LASLNPTGTALNYSTYLDVSPKDISVDEGKAFVTGTWRYPSSSGYRYDAGFVMGVDASGERLILFHNLPLDSVGFSTGDAITVDGRGAVYVLFWMDWPANVPISDDALQISFSTLYIVKLKSTNGRILYSTYLGGTYGWGNRGYDLVADSFGSVYVTGLTYDFDFPTTADAYSTLYGGQGDAFIARIRDSGPTGKLHLNKTKVTFKVPLETTGTFKKNFTIQNKGAGVANYNISTDQNWLTVYPNSGDVRNEKDNIGVSVTVDKQKPGTHKGIVKVSSVDAFNSPQQLIVNLKVKGPTIRVKLKKYSLEATEGSTTPISLTNKIKNKGPGKLRYKLKSLESWMKVTPKRGTSTGEWDPFTVEVDPTGLEAGIHQGIVQVISKDTVDSPFDITITLNVKAEDAREGEAAIQNN
jgi:hypothetical protein